MSEISVLFHNPESLDDSDLSVVRRRIRTHKTIMFGSGLAALGLTYQYTRNQWLCAPAFLVGYFAGNPVAKYVDYTRPWGLSQERDSEIARAFDQKYLTRAFFTQGFGNNSLNAGQH